MVQQYIRFPGDHFVAPESIKSFKAEVIELTGNVRLTLNPVCGQGEQYLVREDDFAQFLKLVDVVHELRPPSIPHSSADADSLAKSRVGHGG